MLGNVVRSLDCTFNWKSLQFHYKFQLKNGKNNENKKPGVETKSVTLECWISYSATGYYVYVNVKRRLHNTNSKIRQDINEI